MADSFSEMLVFSVATLTLEIVRYHQNTHGKRKPFRIFLGGFCQVIGLLFVIWGSIQFLGVSPAVIGAVLAVYAAMTVILWKRGWY